MSRIEPLPGPAADLGSTEDAELASVLEACLAEFEAGRPINLERVEAEHPAIAHRLRACLASMRLVERQAPALTSGGVVGGAARNGRQLGDYRLLREVGRGGMGIVYEAEQVSLGRRVAVKMLPLAATLDSRALQRFKTEVQIAAQLQHSHIVPIYGVGCDHGIYFFVMQFIDGRTASEVIHGREPLAHGPTNNGASAHHPLPFRTTLLPGDSPQSPAAVSSPLPADTRPLPTNFPDIARLMIQAAEALDHAHEMGVIHRDVKPANLLIDDRGHLWVADFGLARLQGDSPMTQTGDVLGTLRYLSPEQARAKRGLVDHRCDVYGLGATLYEWLTRRPVFEGADRTDVLMQIATAEPVPPRKLNPVVPRDLETIVLKALAKNPGDRYETAHDLAEDLRRFLDDRPIRARPPTVVQRLTKWGWRQRTAVGTAAAFLLLLLVVLLMSVGLIWQAKGKAERALSELQAASDREDRAAYRDRVALAHHEWHDSNVGRVCELLEGCRLDLRAWEWHYLNRLYPSGVRDLCDHGATIEALAFSPDGLLATAGTDSPVRFWDGASGELRRTLNLPHGTFKMICSPDGRTLASVSFLNLEGLRTGAALQLHDATTGEVVGRCCHETHRILAMDFSPDGKLLASVHGNHTLRLWDVQTGKQLHSLPCPDGQRAVLAFSTDSRQLVAYTGSVLTIFDLETGRSVSARKLSFSPVLLAALSPGGKQLALFQSHRLTLVDVPTGAERFWPHGYDEPTWRLIYSPDGKLLATGDEGRMVRLWDATTAQELDSFRGHSEPVHHLAFSPDSRRLASASSGRAVKVWDVTRGQDARPWRVSGEPVTGLAFHPASHTVAAASRDRKVRLLDLRTGKETQGPVRSSPVHDVAFSPNGELLATAGADFTVRVGKPDGESEIALPGAVASRRTAGLVRGRGRVAFSPDGRLLAATRGHGEQSPLANVLTVWDVPSSQQLFQVLGEGPDGLTGPVFSPDGRFLAWSPNHKVVALLALATRAEVLRWPAASQVLRDIAFSPDGRELAVADVGGGVSLWNLASAAQGVSPIPRLTWQRHRDAVNRVAFSPNGRRLATASADRTVRIWEVDTGRELLNLRGHQHWVVAVTFSPDGRWLASADQRGTVRIWDGAPRLESPPEMNSSHERR